MQRAQTEESRMLECALYLLKLGARVYCTCTVLYAMAMLSASGAGHSVSMLRARRVFESGGQLRAARGSLSTHVPGNETS